MGVIKGQTSTKVAKEILVDDDGHAQVDLISGGTGGTAMVDDAAFTPATTSFTPIGGQTTVDAVDAGDAGALLMDTDRHLQIDVLSIAAGDNNIGNVDLVTLPAGNLGQQAMAASLSIVPASNITDATYIGDIKFGESLPAGDALIGRSKVSDGTTVAAVDATTTALKVYLATALDSTIDSVKIGPPNAAVENQVVSIASTATAIPTTALTARQSMIIRNVGTQTVYLGKSDVTANETAATGGFPVYATESFPIDLGPSVTLYGIVASGTCNVALLESS